MGEGGRSGGWRRGGGLWMLGSVYSMIIKWERRWKGTVGCGLTYDTLHRQRGRSLPIGCGARKKRERANDGVRLLGI